MRDLAKKALELGDPNEFVKNLAEIDPDTPRKPEPTEGAEKLQAEAEKAFGVGDFPRALAKYGAAADADPKLYEAPLYAGDTAYRMKDLKTAAMWFERATKVDPNRETAYRYWGDALLKYGNDPAAAKAKFLDAIVAEPYNRLSWQGAKNWATTEKVVLQSPKIERPAGPQVDPKNPNGITITVDPDRMKKGDDSGAAWLVYGMSRALYRIS
jgi:tetratricopeptide (TPR) repeat protein